MCRTVPFPRSGVGQLDQEIGELGRPGQERGTQAGELRHQLGPRRELALQADWDDAVLGQQHVGGRDRAPGGRGEVRLATGLPLG